MFFVMIILVDILNRSHDIGNYCYGTNYLSDPFFILNLLTFFFHQVIQMSDGLYQSARACSCARKEYFNCIRSTFRLFIKSSWTFLFGRIIALS